MKTPEEIKKGLDCLRNDNFPGEDCKRCPYLRHPVENTYICNIPERLNDAWDYIKQLEAQVHKWTSVAEHLPQKTGKYLVYSKVGTVYTSTFNPDVHKRWPHFGKVGVTHWMPRPEEPKEGTNDNHC